MDSASPRSAEPVRPGLLDTLLPALGGHAALVDKLRAALVEGPPIDASKGGYIARGFNDITWL